MAGRVELIEGAPRAVRGIGVPGGVVVFGERPRRDGPADRPADRGVPRPGKHGVGSDRSGLERQLA